MKQFLLALGFLLFIGTSGVSYGQMIAFNNQSNPSSCDGYAFFTEMSSYMDPAYSWYWTDADSTLLLTGEDTLADLCAGIYTFHLDSAGAAIHTESFTIGNGDPCNTFAIGNWVVTNTGSGACTGSITLTPVGGTAPYAFNWGNGQTSANPTNLCIGNYTIAVIDASGCMTTGTYTIIDTTAGCDLVILPGGVTNSAANACTGAITPIVQGDFTGYMWSEGSTTQSIDELCPGQYELYIMDTNGCSASFVYTVGEDSTIVPSLINLNLSLINDSTGLCTGVAAVAPTGGTAPYTVFWSNLENGDFTDSLCAGIYSVMVHDATGDSTYFASFAITDPNSTYGNDPYGDSNIVGYLYTNLVENCVIDYADIDSASLYAAVYDSVSQNLYVTWAIYSPTDTVYISDTLGFNGGNGVYNLTISVFCPQKTTGNYLSIIGQILIQNNVNVAGIEENTLANVVAYPNPFNDAFTVTTAETGNYRVTLRDAMGRTILANEFEQTNTITVRPEQAIAAGSYFLTIESATGSTVIRLAH